CQRVLRCEIKHEDVPALTVVHVQALTIRRKRQPIRLRQILRQQGYFSRGIETKDALKRELLLLPLGQVERGISEIDRTVGTDYDVIGTVELFAFEAGRQNFVLSFGINSNNRPQNTGAINESLLTVVGVAVGVAERNQLLFSSIHVHAKNFVS